MSGFAAEQQALAAMCWQLVAIRAEIAAPGSWIRRTVFGTDIFVQNFDGEPRGFHNVCSHRGFPIRREPAGTGPVQCGFHGWGYNRDGTPTSIPRNAELFGLTRDQRVALALPTVRVEQVGQFVFASLAADGPSAVEFVGPYADVIRAITSELGPLVHHAVVEIRANWKLHAEITLDDYHLHSVHPTTFGAHPSDLFRYVYRRDGLHSCLLRRRDPDWTFDRFWSDVRDGVMDRTGYKIFNCFPGLSFAAIADVLVVTSVSALAADRTEVTNYVFAWKDGGVTPEAREALATYYGQIIREDLDTCERWQTGGTIASPVLGRLEERIAWFRESYAEVIRRAAAGSPAATEPRR